GCPDTAVQLGGQPNLLESVSPVAGESNELQQSEQSGRQQTQQQIESAFSNSSAAFEMQAQFGVQPAALVQQAPALFVGFVALANLDAALDWIVVMRVAQLSVALLVSEIVRLTRRYEASASQSNAMSASAIYILDTKGKVLISRNYRGDVPMSTIEKFMPLLVEREEEGTVQPVLPCDDAYFMYISHNNVYLVATTRKNANAGLVFTFLHKIADVFVEYFKDLEEESIRDNFVIVYELLDEVMDFGFPQTTDTRILQEFITQESHKLEVAPKLPPAVTNAVSWRSEGIKYRKNEVFLDVIESVNLLVSVSGNVLRSEIVGSVRMRDYLSGMPELRLGLNDKVLFDATGRGKSKSVELEDVKFHQCVRLSRFENDRTISFIPPDGDFELMSYRLNTQVKPLIWVECAAERHAHSRVEYMIKAKSQFKRRSTANNVDIIIPVPADVDSPKFKTTVGSCRYQPESSSLVWSIKAFPGGKEFIMRAHFGLPTVDTDESNGKPPIAVKFEIPYFTVSGIQVRYLKIIEKSGYQALPWVRYITQNGEYQLRTQ
uniref:MHD domain-containing protein n=1 Tax=Macrostomum lignano TaxID=282301 RepID=A0A1I8IK55_9PLAT